MISPLTVSRSPNFAAPSIDKLDGGLPDHIEEIIDTKSGAPCSLAFNRRGTILAAGTNDGCIALIDFDTKNRVMLLQGHPQGSVVKEVCWSRDGRTLASVASNEVVLWDVLSGKRKALVNLPHNDARSLYLSQRSPFCALVSYASPGHPPSLIDFESSSCQSLPASETRTDVQAVMSKEGDIFVAIENQLSKIDMNLKAVESIVAPGLIRKVTACQKSLIISCDNGQIFVYSDGELTAAPKGPFFHSIDDSSSQVIDWNDFCLTQDGCYLAAVANLGSLQRSSGEHLVYFWSLASCELERVLEGLDEKDKCNAFTITAHPTLPVIVTASDPASQSTLVYVWAKIQVENWSAFAPDFEELQENKLYIESEDEFDWNTDGNMSTKIELMEKRKSFLAAEREEDLLTVDVFTMGKRADLLPSDDEGDEDALHYLDVDIQPDPVATPAEDPPQTHDEDLGDIDVQQNAIKAIQEAEAAEEDLNEEDGINCRRTRSRNNSRVNSRATSPSAADDGDQGGKSKRQKI